MGSISRQDFVYVEIKDVESYAMLRNFDDSIEDNVLNDSIEITVIGLQDQLISDRRPVYKIYRQWVLWGAELERRWPERLWNCQTVFQCWADPPTHNKLHWLIGGHPIDVRIDTRKNGKEIDGDGSKVRHT